MGININDISPLSESLLSDNESLLGNIRDLLAEELKISGGGGYKCDDDCDDDDDDDCDD